MAPERRNTFPLKFKAPKVDSLQELSTSLTTFKVMRFNVSYGRILPLFDVDVDMAALTALVQYYDPPLRCLTFQDFQLAQTIEEYERILNHYVKDHDPFVKLGEKIDPKEIAEALYLEEDEVTPYLKPRGEVKGFTRKFLENKARDLEKAENWEAFSAVLALLIYGIVLFPNEEDFVDLPVVGVFLAKTAVPTLLADVYYHLNVRHEKKKGIVLCCAPLLYIWLREHMPRQGEWIEILNNLKWSQKLASLTANAMFWYTHDWAVDSLIHHCGNFPNVPLIGSRGCINYNPELALRQHEYSMKKEPETGLLKEFIITDMGASDPSMLKRVKRAWSRIHRKGKEFGKRTLMVEEP
ncbi:uncharacterized protein LOC131604885 [Vicia villosa]|uniref:uncharacterized protein LOC131604885 n=1 Tax=Vicia villosa TaxID=3911 RepID=UPI00273BCA21|nr:uncharacterized protein LOC131604885 [Vicia villosa]